jgi:hypothetical protein
LASVGHLLVHGRCLRILDSICDASWWPKIPFHCVVKNVTMFSSCWCDTCQWWRGDLSLVDLFFLLLLFSFIPWKLQLDFLWFWYLNFNPHFFNSIFFLGPFGKTLIGFQFHPSIQIFGIIFFNLILIVLNSNFFLSYFIKILLVFNFIIQPNFMVYYFYQFSPLFFFHFVKVIFLFNFTL